MDLFEHQFEEQKKQDLPLATRMRPNRLDDFVGQEHLVGGGRVLRKAIESGQLPSFILWGPPGSGKTTLAFIIAHATKSFFSPVSAVNAGVSDLRQVVSEAKERRRLYQQKTILFIDEIHRFNKAQQDAILPFVEDGAVTLIGATTENPSFEVISPLLSRCRVLTLKPLSVDDIRIIILRALSDTLDGIGNLHSVLNDDAMLHLIMMSNNDARVALNALETAALTTPPHTNGKRYLSLDIIEDVFQRRALPYDKNGNQHYDLVSALIKSVRGSDPDAALYWLARMLEGGEDPLFIVRRLVILASEDVGLADPQALIIATSAQQAVNFVGMPEASLALAEATVYLAAAPKSNSIIRAYSSAQEEAKKGASEPVPLHLRNPVTPLMKQVGYGKDYKYAHNYPGHFVGQRNLPPALQKKRFYTPGDQGYEKEIDLRLKNWWQGDKNSPQSEEEEQTGKNKTGEGP